MAAVRTCLCSGEKLEDAVDRAVEKCICEGILKEFLSKHRAEVQDMILTEYNEQRHMELERKEAKAEGKAEDIVLLLSDLGEVPEYLSSKIKAEKESAILSSWLRLAARAQSIEEFVEKSAGI